MLSFLVFIAVLSILIIAHEFGHFIVAKRSGVKVECFSIGFGPVLFRKKGKETEFLLCLLPLGGYVKLAGDSHQDYHGQSNEFLSKSAKVKIAIVLAGPLFNYIFAFLIFWGMFVSGFPYTQAIVGKLKAGSPAASSGIKENDKILAVNGKETDSWVDMTKLIRASRDKVSLKIERGGRIILVDVPLRISEVGDKFGKKKNVATIGIEPSSKIRIVKYNLFESFIKGFQTLIELTGIIVQGFASMIFGIIPIKEAVTGPLGIYYITAEAVKVGMAAILHLMAVLSVSLSIINLIPLPLFDGGHILVFLIERFRKKHLSKTAEEYLTRLGFVIIAVIVLFVFYNDVVRFGSKIWGK